jgi:O-antigen/teichoic acid export membrane protein
MLPLYLGCIALPLYGLTMVQDGIARSYGWINLALSPLYIIRPVAIIAFMIIAHLVGFSTSASTVMVSAIVATWSTAILQLVMLNRRLKGKVEGGAKAFELGTWLTTSLPVLLVGSAYFLLTYTDVLVLQEFRPPEEVAVYFAATKILALVTFVYFSVWAVVARKFSEYHLTGDRARLAAFVTRSTRWTFWPSLAATIILLAVGRPILWLFGPEFARGYMLLPLLAIGILARASVGPAERLLNMLGQQRACASVYAAALMFNLVACFVLIPRYGMTGAAISTSMALVFESLALFLVARHRLGLHVFIFGMFSATADACRSRN